MSQLYGWPVALGIALHVVDCVLRGRVYCVHGFAFSLLLLLSVSNSNMYHTVEKLYVAIAHGRHSFNTEYSDKTQHFWANVYHQKVEHAQVYQIPAEHLHLERKLRLLSFSPDIQADSQLSHCTDLYYIMYIFALAYNNTGHIAYAAPAA